MPKKKPEKIGAMFGRPDIERCDLFVDMGYLSWGKYSRGARGYYEDAVKGRQILAGIPGTKCGMQAQSGYFDPVFRKPFDRDKFVDSYKLKAPKSGKPYLAGEWVPPGATKKHCTPGDIFGTFVKQHEAFSPLKRPPKLGPPTKGNFYTNPGKKGNCGYLDICLNKYPEHIYNGRVDDYEASRKLASQKWVTHKEAFKGGPFNQHHQPRPFFEENPYKGRTPGKEYVPRPEKNVVEPLGGPFVPPGYPKKPGNMHDGCFSKFPEYKGDKYMTLYEVKKLLAKIDPKYEGLVFSPEPQLKTNYSPSVVNNKIDFCCNERTWRTMKPITYPQFNY